MSHQNVEPRVKPRRIDAPHTVVTVADQTPDRVPELAAAGNRTVPVRRAQPAAVDSSESESATSLAAPVYPSSPLDSAALREKEAELFALATSLTQREEQLDHQSAQLSGQLQEQLRELEQREAQLNARAAELDNEYRQARLWAKEQLVSLREREGAVAAKEAELEAQRTELKLWQEQAEQSLVQKEILACQRLSEQLQQHEERYREIESRENALEKNEAELASRQQQDQEREASLAAREQQLESKEAHIRERRQFIEREAAALHHARQEWERSHEAERDDLEKKRAQIRLELCEAIKEKEESLTAGEIALGEQTLTLENDRQSLARERADWQRQKGADREAIALLKSRAEVELEQRRTRLATRETALEQQQAALDQLRGEITTAHRQSIEMRLMAEQLWAQVQGRMPPLEITQSIAQLRLKLGEQYKMEQRSLGEQKQELLKLAEKIASQSTELRTQRHELQSWFASREEEIERHAEALVIRERELMEQSDKLRDSENRWNSDRRQLEQEVREMRSRLRQTAA